MRLILPSRGTLSRLVHSNELRQADRRDLDDAVLELLGISSEKERHQLIDRLYEATARHFRDIRVVEIEKMQQRAKSDNRRFSVYDLAADIWDAAELAEITPLAEWVSQRPESELAVSLPNAQPVVLRANPLFGDAAVGFGKTKSTYVECESEEQAKLVYRLASLGVSGNLNVPKLAVACSRLLELVNARIDTARNRFQELADSRTGDEDMRQQLLSVLIRWFVLGRERDHGVAHSQ